jgi:hypothetical protein
MSPTPSTTFSELVNKPVKTIEKMDRAPRNGIRITRRDEPDLYLTTAERAEQVVEIVDTTTRLFIAMMKTEPMAVDVLTKVFPEAFPWVQFLPTEAVREFLMEFVNTAKASTSLDVVDPILAVIAAWKATAEAYSDPDIYAALTRDDGEDAGPLPMPEMAGE